MKTTFRTLLLFLLISALSQKLSAQNKEESASLVKQGIELNDAGKYDEAVEKYKEALKDDPDNLQADYEIGFTLYNSGKANEAIPYLETILKSNGSKYETYELLGSIYDDNKQSDKAIELYKLGIQEKPDYERLHFNLGISYLRSGKFADAENCEIDAIKLDPKHASSQRIYAMATLDEHKRMCSLLAWCSFLLLEPQSARSAAAYANIRNILNYGISKKDDKSITINVSDQDLASGDLEIQMAVTASTLDKKNLSPVDSLTLQLTSLFEIAGEQKEGTKDDFCSNFYAKFFSKLAVSGNMPALARLLSLSAYKDENLAWFKANPKQLSDLDMWIRTTPRSF